MTKKKILLVNRLLAEFMGFEKVEIGYFGTEDETEWQKDKEKWMDKVGLDNVGNFFVSIRQNKWHYCEDVKYHSSWDWIMPVIEKIESLGYDTVIDFRNNPYSQRKDGMSYWAQIGKDKITDDIFGTSYESKMESVIKCVVKFIQWYNQQNKK